jgi:hypothetical protein
MQCAQAGAHWFEPVRQELRASHATFTEPEFAYNREFDTCLCMYGSFIFENHTSDRRCTVWDTLANRPIASFENVNGKVTSRLTQDQFDAEASKLMGTSQSCFDTERWATRP